MDLDDELCLRPVPESFDDEYEMSLKMLIKLKMIPFYFQEILLQYLLLWYLFEF